MLSYVWADSDYPSLEDNWVCESCDETLPSRRYSDWFGQGDTDEELKEYLESNEDTPLRIFYDGYMVCIVFAEYVVVFGYDGNEYVHTFCFEEPTDKIASQLFRLGIRKH
mgnify:FL=1